MNIKLLNYEATIPTRGTEYSAGYDLYACNDATITPGGSEMVGTGVAMEIPESCVGLVFARSGLACKQGLRPANCVGVIDSDYRGEIKVCLYNDANQNRFVDIGDRIAQLVIVPFMAPELVVVNELEDTERGEGGFGHTGK